MLKVELRIILDELEEFVCGELRYFGILTCDCSQCVRFVADDIR